MRCVLPLPFTRRLWLAMVVVAAFASAWPVVARAADPSPVPSPTESPADSPSAEKPIGTPHPSSEAVKKELAAVIDAQLAAFRANDFEKAYGFAASAIKDLFAADAFEKMVRTAYPVIAHSSTADYGMTFDTGEEAVVNVRISNAEKKSVEYQYLLKKEDGQWRIGGVAEVRAQGLSV